MSHTVFLLASTRESGHMGNTEWLARRAAAQLPPDTRQTWLSLAHLQLPAFVDQRHTVGSYPLPEGDLHTVLDATLDATDLVLVAPCTGSAFRAHSKPCSTIGAPGCGCPTSISKRAWPANACG